MADDYARWRNALAGQPMDFGAKNDPACGYYRNLTPKGIEAVAIYKEGGAFRCWRNIFGDGSKMAVEEIDELFGNVGLYPVSYEAFIHAANGGEWPPEYGTRLTMKEIQANVAWTPDLGIKKLGSDLEQDQGEAAENPRAVIGGNNPPEELPIDRQLAERIASAAKRVSEWLASIGGAPKTKEQADKVADYATRFGDLHGEAEKAFKAEKEPWLKGGRAVDAKWKFRDEATTLRKKYLDIANKWIGAENARLAEEARKANDAAIAAARKDAEALNEPVREIAPIEPQKVTIGNTRAVSQRSRAVYVVKDVKAFSAYLSEMENPPPDFIDVLGKLANKLGAAGVNAPGIEKENVRSAA
jgi:hypothetical protein